MRARIADILYHASQLSGVSVEQILGRSRKQQIVRTRHAVCMVAREQMGANGPAYSFPTIGRAFGKDHSTIIHGCTMAAETVRRDPVYAEFVEALRQASTAPPFAQMRLDPITVASPPPRFRKSIKAVTLNEGEEGDEGHKFHAAIAMGSAALLKALAA